MEIFGELVYHMKNIRFLYEKKSGYPSHDLPYLRMYPSFQREFVDRLIRRHIKLALYLMDALDEIYTNVTENRRYRIFCIDERELRAYPPRIITNVKPRMIIKNGNVYFIEAIKEYVSPKGYEKLRDLIDKAKGDVKEEAKGYFAWRNEKGWYKVILCRELSEEEIEILMRRFKEEFQRADEYLKKVIIRDAL